MKTEVDLRTQSPPPTASAFRPEPELGAEPPPAEHELVIREARRRRRKRWLASSAAVLVLVASGVITAMALGAGGESPPPAKAPAPQTSVRAPTPPPPAFSAGAFTGTWRVHTTSVTIGTDGTGIATWPGDVAPGGSEATAIENKAELRLTTAQGSQASGVISGSTDQAQLPDGPVQLHITSQDLLAVVPSQPVSDTPLRWTALCGASALSLTVAQQVAAGINCGA
jgi:hypothetical protein